MLISSSCILCTLQATEQLKRRLTTYSPLLKNLMKYLKSSPRCSKKRIYVEGIDKSIIIKAFTRGVKSNTPIHVSLIKSHLSNKDKAMDKALKYISLEK